MNFLEYEKKNPYIPIKFEEIFGLEGVPPAELTFNKQKILLCGKIDRIDKTDDGYCIIDYKCSKYSTYNNKIMDGGSKIQPFLYAEAYKKKEKIDDKQVFRVGYITIKDSSTPILTKYAAWMKKNLDYIITYATDLMKQGYFFQSGKCEYCDYTAVCSSHVDVQIRFKLKNDKKGFLKKITKIQEFE